MGAGASGGAERRQRVWQHSVPGDDIMELQCVGLWGVPTLDPLLSHLGGFFKRFYLFISRERAREGER